MHIELVRAKDEDEPFLLELRKLTMVEHLEKAALFLSDDDHLARVKIHFNDSYILKRNNKPVGFLKYIENEKAIEILQLQILPQFQGQGIGNYILHELRHKTEKLQKDLILKVLKENPARYLYERNGFKVVGEDSYEFYMKLGKF